MQKWIAFQFGLEGSCAFLFKSLRFISDLNIHVFVTKCYLGRNSGHIDSFVYVLWCL